LNAEVEREVVALGADVGDDALAFIEYIYMYNIYNIMISWILTS
jgi:hypothetical protein